MSKIKNLLKEYLELRETARKLSQVEFDLRNLSQPQTTEHTEAEKAKAAAWKAVNAQAGLIAVLPPVQLPAELAEALQDVKASEAWKHVKEAEKAFLSSPERVAWEKSQAEKSFLEMDFPPVGTFPGEKAYEEARAISEQVEYSRSAIHANAQALAEEAALYAYEDGVDANHNIFPDRGHLEQAWKQLPSPVPPEDWKTSPAAYRRLVKRRAAQLLGLDKLQK